MALRGISRIKCLVVLLNVSWMLTFIAIMSQSSRKRYPWEEQREIIQSANVIQGEFHVPQHKATNLNLPQQRETTLRLSQQKETTLRLSQQKETTLTSSQQKETTLTPSENIQSIENISSDFQAVGDSIETFVYSAFYDDVQTPIIRVIALVRELEKAALSHKFTCTYPNDVKADGPLQYVKEPKWGYRYRSAMILCELPKGSRPEFVTVNQHGSTGARNEMRVIYPLHRKYNLTKCFSAVHSNFNNTIQFMQTMELSLMFGIEHFVVYNYSIAPNVLEVMEKYREMGLLEIIPWQLPIDKHDIHYYAQLTAIQECLYRNLHVSDYIFTGDTDEVFVPKTTNSSLDIIKSYFRGHASCSCLVIRNAFFPLNLSPFRGDFPYRSEAQRLKLTYLQYTSHTKIFNPYDRSKLVIKPTGVEVGGIHGIEKYRRGRNGCVCSTKECLLHHYRILKKEEMSKFSQTDTSLHKYSQELTLRISDRLRKWGLS